jgi:hypothetical protein
MAGSITVSSITLDSDNNFSIKSNTGATLFSANGSGIVSGVQNTAITGVITGTQLAANSVNSTIIAANTISNTNIQTGAIENYGRASGLFAMRNRIINGAMVIDQRNAGASVTPASNPTYTLDRWVYTYSQNSKFSVQQNAGSVTPPAGFTNYIGFTSLAATSLGSTDYFILRQMVEGFNTADLAFGTASAKTITLSFWVRSSLTGTFGGAISNSGESRNYPFTYTISSANTWEQKSVTIAGDTSGTWLTTNGIGIELSIGLGVGSTYSGTAGAWTSSLFVGATGATNVAGTNGATFYITGVQLEVGSSATGFEYRQYGQELVLCQRYFQRLGSLSGSYVGFGAGRGDGGSGPVFYMAYANSVRATPTISQSNTGVNTPSQYTASGLGAIYYGVNSASVVVNMASGTVASGAACLWLGNNNPAAYVDISAEL